MLAIILARAGSKGLPGKNLRPLRGHPLVAWSIDAARRSGLFARIVVSTDGEDIARISKRYGAEVVDRPKKLATDTATPKSAMAHVCQSLAEDGFSATYGVLLQPTSPLRNTDDIAETVKLVTDSGFDSAASFSQAIPHPLRAFVVEQDGRARQADADSDIWRPRQQREPYYHLNGAVYVVRTRDLLSSASGPLLTGSIGAHIMPPERSIDIDTAVDFKIAEALMDDRPEPLQ